MVRKNIENHKFNYDLLIATGDIKVTRSEYIVLVRKLDLEGIDYHAEPINDDCYGIEVY